MRIYIRHAEKAYTNGNSKNYKHDPGLTEQGTQDAIEFGKLLVNKYGPPVAIVCSPYLRTRQTAELMSSILEKPVKINCDPRLSEYLGNHAQEKIDVTDETLECNPPHPEKLHEFEARVKNHYEDFSEFDDLTRPMWIITHGLVVTTITKFIGRSWKRLPPLGAVCVRNECQMNHYSIINPTQYIRKSPLAAA